MAQPEHPDPGLPIKLGPCSNGEFEPAPASDLVRRTIELTNEAVERKAHRLGMSRRRFLQSSVGAATSLAVLAACTRESGQTGGTYDIDGSTTVADAIEGETSTTMEEEVAADVVGPGDEEFIFDVQNHLLDYPDGAGGAPGFPQSACGEADPADCYGIEHYLELLFVESDTHMAMLSAIPFGDGALSPEVMERTIEAADRLGCRDRVLMQGESFPTSAGLDAMMAVAENFPIRAFKTYTHAGGPSWRLDDDVGDAYFTQVKAAGVPVVAVHKGISGNDPASSPVDVGPAARNHPEVDICVYHSGYEPGSVEGPYDPDDDTGANRLITSVLNAGIGSDGNVHAELGSTWRALMASPDEAAHLLGKLLVHLGPDNILWGTDSIWYGSPQDQIQAFRTFTISEEFQQRFGYPELTPEIKAGILGRNAARLFGIDPTDDQCLLDRDGLSELREERAMGRTHHTHAEAGLRAFLDPTHT